MIQHPYVFPPEKMAEMDRKTVETFVDDDFEPDFIFGFSPYALRCVICNDIDLGDYLIARLNVISKSKSGNTQCYSFHGFSGSMRKSEWAAKMRDIAKRFLRGDDSPDAAEDISSLEPTCLDTAIEDARPTFTGESATEKDCLVDKSASAPNGPKFLPIVYEGKAAVPNVITRSSFIGFGSKRDKRQSWTADKPLVLTKFSGYRAGVMKLSYVGAELRLSDIALWWKLIAISSRALTEDGSRLPLGEEIAVNRNTLMKALGRGVRSSNSVKAFWTDVTRLQAAVITIDTTCPHMIRAMTEHFPDSEVIKNAKKTGRLKFSFNLMSKVRDNGRQIGVVVAKEVVALFGNSLSTWFDEDTYFSLSNDFCKRLYLLYGSHVDCYPLTLEELREWIGTKESAVRNACFAIDAAHDELAAKKIIKGWHLGQDERRAGKMCYIVQHHIKARRPAERKAEAVTA